MVIFLYWCINLVSTILYAPSQIYYVLHMAYIMIALVLFMYYTSEKSLKELLTALSIIYGAFIFLNWILFMIYPNGIYNPDSYHIGHLLGDDNAIIYVALPGLICIVCNSIKKNKKISFFTWFLLFVTEFTFIKLWAASALLCLTLFIVGLIFAYKTNKPNPKTVLILVLCVIFIVLFGLSNSFVQRFIVNVLHKDITLSNRTLLWNLAIQYIMQKPILGYGGYFVKGQFKAISNSWYTYPCHTTYLQLAIDGGFILLFVFILTTFFGYNTISKDKENLYSRILAIGLGCMLINYITEYAQLMHYTIIICLMLNITSDTQTEKENKYEKYSINKI